MARESFARSSSFHFHSTISRRRSSATSCLTEPVTSHRHIVLAFVTSRQSEEPLDTDVVLDPEDPDFAQTGLHVRSTIRTHRLLTVASSIVKRELGSLSSGLRACVADAAQRLFALEPDGGRKAETDVSPQA